VVADVFLAFYFMISLGALEGTAWIFLYTKLRFEIWQIHSHPLSRGFSISFAFEWFFTSSTYNCHLLSSWDFSRLIFHLLGGHVVD
jgi:hypothetical protein